MTPERNPLEKISRELDALDKQDIATIIKRGDLLQRAKDLLHAHGSWVGWLKTRHAMPPRTAQRYMRAARFAKNATVAHLPTCKLTANALYLLSEDRFWRKAGIDETGRHTATETVLQAASKEKLGEKQCKQIIKEALGISDQAPPLVTAETPMPELSTVNKRFKAAVMELRDLFATKAGTQTWKPGYNDTCSKEIVRRARANIGVVPVEIVQFVIEALSEVVRASTSEEAIVVNKTCSPQEVAHARTGG